MCTVPVATSALECNVGDIDVTTLHALHSIATDDHLVDFKPRPLLPLSMHCRYHGISERSYLVRAAVVLKTLAPTAGRKLVPPSRVRLRTVKAWHRDLVAQRRVNIV